MSRARRLQGAGRTKERRHQQRRTQRAEHQERQRVRRRIAPVARESWDGYAVSDEIGRRQLWCTEDGYRPAWAGVTSGRIIRWADLCWKDLWPSEVDALLRARWLPNKPKSAIDKLANLVSDG